MRLWTKLFMIPLIGLSSFAFDAYAALEHANWKTEGDKAITVDTSTGLEWLKLSKTAGLSMNAVMAQLGNGGSYKGWRLPTDSEVESLMKSIFPALAFNEDATTYGGSGYRNYTATWREWMGLVRYTSSGPSGNSNKYYYSYGLYLGDNGTPEMSGTYYRVKDSFGTRTYYSNIYDDLSDVSFTMDFSSINYGVFLVADGGMTLDPNGGNVELPGGGETPGQTPGGTPPVANVPAQGFGFFMLAILMSALTRRRTTK